MNATNRNAPSDDLVRPGAHDPSPAVSDATRQRLAELERVRPRIAEPIRHALGFMLGVGIWAVLVDRLGAWGSDGGRR